MSDSTGSNEFGLGNRYVRWGAMLWFLGTAALGTYGYYLYQQDGSHDITVLGALYYTVQLFFLQSQSFDRPLNIYLELARWFAPLLTGLAFYKFAERVIRLEWGARKLSRMKDHVIVAGFGRKGVEFATHEREKNRQVVAIDRIATPAVLEQCRDLGVLFLVGDAMQQDVLAAAGLRRAATLYAVCDEDSTNCEIAAQAGALLNVPEVAQSQSTKMQSVQPRASALRCRVHISDIDLRDELQQFQHMQHTTNGSNVRFFDLFDHEARKLLIEQLPIDHDGIREDSPRRAHVILFGFGRMGRSIAVRAAKLGHFANAARDPQLRLRISVIDRDAAHARESLLFRHPNIERCCDIEFHSLAAESGSARTLLERWCADSNSLPSVIVCFDNEPRAVEIVTRMLPVFNRYDTRVAVRLATNTQLSGLGRTIWSNAGLESSVREFGSLKVQCREANQDDSETERIAQSIHREYVTQRRAAGQAAGSDRSLADWESLNESFRESNRQQAHHMVIKMRAIGCDVVDNSDERPSVNPMEEPANTDVVELLSKMEHNRWNAERWLDGWTYAPGTRNTEARTTPYLVPWDELTDEIREYDREAVRAIPHRLREAGKKIVKT